MHVALYIRDRLPVTKYGGTQRVAVYLARGLADAGHRVTLLAHAGTRVREASVVELPPAPDGMPPPDLRQWMPNGLDLLMAYSPVAATLDVPWIRSLHGNRKPGTVNAPNTLYLSRDHATRHGGRAFVYNGIDLAEFRFEARKADYDLCLGRLRQHRVLDRPRRGADRRLHDPAHGVDVSNNAGDAHPDLLGPHRLIRPAR